MTSYTNGYLRRSMDPAYFPYVLAVSDVSLTGEAVSSY
jgi:hypothetical protein